MTSWEGQPTQSRVAAFLSHHEQVGTRLRSRSRCYLTYRALCQTRKLQDVSALSKMANGVLLLTSLTKWCLGDPVWRARNMELTIPSSARDSKCCPSPLVGGLRLRQLQVATYSVPGALAPTARSHSSTFLECFLCANHCHVLTVYLLPREGQGCMDMDMLLLRRPTRVKVKDERTTLQCSISISIYTLT